MAPLVALLVTLLACSSAPELSPGELEEVTADLVGTTAPAFEAAADAAGVDAEPLRGLDLRACDPLLGEDVGELVARRNLVLRASQDRGLVDRVDRAWRRLGLEPQRDRDEDEIRADVTVGPGVPAFLRLRSPVRVQDGSGRVLRVVEVVSDCVDVGRPV